MALAINHLFPVDPERLVERTARPIFDKLAAVLEEVAAALKAGDPERATRTLMRAREIDEMVRVFNESLT
ncbi:MAG: hypothetical protein M3117_01000, partial [Actinomycetota bacterium]|nr:hypothetical protein [Actinomycetota bacterium]